VDKRLTVRDLPYERLDVVTGAALTGIIGLFVVVSCAGTLHKSGLTIRSAADAALALGPVAGHLAGALFAVGLVGAALLAAAVLPLSTAYSVCDLTGSPAGLDAPFTKARVFYLSDIAVTGVASALVLLPHVPLVPLLVGTQTLNAILLLPLLVAMHLLSRAEDVMGTHVVRRWRSAAQLIVLAGVSLSVVLLLL
jgi:Mn2+/Fe2+ NRAMP family transporter